MMLKRRIVAAASAETRLEAAGRWLDSVLAESAEVLVVATSRGAADEVLRRSCPEGGGLFGVHRVTPLQLAGELATAGLARSGRLPVTGLGLEALAARAISRCSAAGELSYFEPVAETPGMARALAATLRELRGGGADAAALAVTGEPGADLSRLLKRFQDELERRSLVDDAALLRIAGEEIARDAEPSRRETSGALLLGLPLLLLDLELASRAERRFLAAVVGRSPSTFATLVRGDEEGARALEGVLEVAVETLGDEFQTAVTQLGRLRQRVFQASSDRDVEAEDGAEDGVAPDDEADETFSFFSAAGEGRECVEIARRIRTLVKDGVVFDRIAILLRDPDSYLPLVEEALRRAKIPAYFTRGTVRPDPAGRAFLALLDCRAEDFSATRFAEYLSLGQVPTLDDAGAPPVVEVPWVMAEGDQLVFTALMSEEDATALEAGEPAQPVEEAGPEGTGTPAIAGSLRTPRDWERLLVDARVIGGFERWHDRLRGLQAELKLRLEGVAQEDRASRSRLRTQIERLGHLERFALPVIQALSELPASAFWGEWLEALESLASRVLKEPDKVLKLLAELRPMDRVGPVVLDEVRRVLSRRLSFLRQEPPSRHYGRVFVATVAEARGRSFEAVFLPGLAEGTFPRRALEDPLLLDVYRRRLEAELVTQDERVTRERLLLRIAAGAARSRLTVSYPNLDVLQGRPRVPSFYALDLLRAAEGRIPDLRRLEARATEGSQSLLGWPAPRRCETAIDEAEFDLSVLEPLLRRSATFVGRGDSVEPPGRGGARFLLTNPRLDRSLRGRYLRWKRNSSFTSADGVVDPDPKTLEALGQYRLDQLGYSPTALERYAACPYRFLLYSIHGLRPREAAVRLEQLDPLTRGTLFHRIQFELFQALEKRDLLSFDDGEEGAIMELLANTVESVAERYHGDLAPAIERVWRSEIENLHTDLRGWVRSRVTAGEPWRPVQFELGFGLKSESAQEAASDLAEPSEVTEESPEAVQGDLFASLEAEGAAEAVSDEPFGEARLTDGKRLRGAVDLVEEDFERGLLRVTDHKTGKSPQVGRLMVGGGKTLQPVLYGLAMESLLERPVAAGRLSFCTRRGRYLSLEVPLNDDTRRAAAEVLDEIDRAIWKGFLPAAPDEGACRGCDYHLVCGPNEEVRIRRKHPQRLIPLARLRSLP